MTKSKSERLGLDSSDRFNEDVFSHINSVNSSILSARQRKKILNEAELDSIVIEYEEEYANIARIVTDAGSIIDQEDTAEKRLESTVDKLHVFAEWARALPASPLSALFCELFPEIAEDHSLSTVLAKDLQSALPKTAPALWQSDKVAGETPPTFIKKHYGLWLGQGLTRPDVKRLDPHLYVALSNWLRSNPMPPDIELPTLKEANDVLAARLRTEGVSVVGPMTAREAGRLRGIAQRRKM